MNDIINISNENNPSILLKVLVAFYVLVGSSLIQPLLSKQWITMIENNRLIQHVIGITTLIALTTLLSNGTLNNLAIIIYSIVGYLWFVFSTKLDIHWNIIIMILVISAFMCYNQSQRSNLMVNLDKNLSDDEKKIILEKNNLNTLYAMLGILFVTIFGVTMYSNKKEVQYGGGYSIVNFLLY